MEYFVNLVQDKRYCGRRRMKDKPITEFVLLGALMSGPMHGYEILRFLGCRPGICLAGGHKSALRTP